MSVVIPLYNGAPYLEQAIRGVLGQTYDDLELIVIDDGSSDGSAVLAERIVNGDRRALLARFPNGGVAKARNRGLARAKGRYVAFLDQDDVWYPEKLEQQIPLLDERPDLVAVGSFMDYIGDDGRRLAQTAQTPDVIDCSLVSRAELMPFPLSSAVFRTEPLRRGGLSRDLFGPGMATAADLEVMAAVATLGELDCVRRPLGAYRIHPTSVTARSHRTQMAALAYLQAVIAEPGLESRTPWPAFEASYRPRFTARMHNLVVFNYRQAGLEAVQGRWWRTASHLLRAAALGPRYTITRLRRQFSTREGFTRDN